MEIPHPTITAIKLCYFTAFPWKFESTQVNQDLNSWAEASGYIMPPPCHMTPQDNSTTWHANPRTKTTQSKPHHTIMQPQRASRHTRPQDQDHATTQPLSLITIGDVTVEKAELTASMRHIETIPKWGIPGDCN